MHRPGQGVGRQIHCGAGVEIGQPGRVTDHHGGPGVVEEQVALGLEQGGVQQDGHHPDPERPEDRAQQRGRRRQREGHPVARPEAGGLERAGGAAL